VRRQLLLLLASVFLVSFASSTSAAGAEVFPAGATGHDLSFPQCGSPLAAKPPTFVIVGATGGKPFMQNPCLATQYAWAASAGGVPSLYLNLKSPVGTNSDEALSGPRGACRPEERECQAYNFGFKSAQHALTYAASQRAIAASWWLDVETTNTWSSDTAMNAIVIGGAIDFLKGTGATVGIYSSQTQWLEIAGGYKPGLPVWVAMAPNAAMAPRHCTRGFGGGEVHLVQYIVGGADMNYACTAADRTVTTDLALVGIPGSLATVVTDSGCLNVRAQAGLIGAAGVCLPAGTQVTLLEGSSVADGYHWHRISSGSTVGWVAGTYLRSVTGSTAGPVPVIEAPSNRGKITTGSVPRAGGFGLIVFGGGTNAELLTASGCAATSAVFWASNSAGGFDAYVPGAGVEVVNAAWNSRFGGSIPADTALIGRCQ
jgi:hypothetical protein